MGRDVVSLSRHNLDVSSFETLAKDISNRIQFNIEYGYWANENYSKMLNTPCQDGFTKLGSEIFNPNRDTIYRLCDENYQEKLLYEKYGDELFSMKEYNYGDEISLTQSEIEELKSEIYIINFELCSEITGTVFCIIGENFLRNKFDYFLGWWGFCGTLIDECYDYHIPDFIKYRKNMMRYCKLFGGNKIYYLDDQSDYLKGIGQGDEFEYYWIELIKEIYKRANNDVVSISKIILNHNFKRKLAFNKEFPLVFFDDFKDLI